MASSKTSVHKLPTEILAKIFALLAVIDPPRRYTEAERKPLMFDEEGHFKAYDRSSIRSPIHWIEITRVCRYWREIALSQCSLWTHPLLHLGPEWYLTFLRRAGSAPLTIELADYCRRMVLRSSCIVPDAVFDAVLGQMDHVEVLKISSPAHPDELSIFASYTTPAPMLQTLEIKNHSSKFPIYLRSSSIDYHPPKKGELPPPETIFLGADFPRLQNVTLHGISDDWLSMSFRNLVKLDVAHTEYIESYDPLLDILESSPGLEFLSIVHALPHHCVSFVERPHRVVLPNLKAITLSSNYDTCTANVLRSIEMPATVRIRLSFVKPTSDKYTALFADLRAHFSRGDPPSFQHLKISASSHELLIGGSWPSSLTGMDMDEFGIHNKEPTSFFFSTPFHFDPQGVIRTAFDGFPLDCVKTLILHDANSSELWDHVLTRPGFYHVTLICIEDDFLRSRPDLHSSLTAMGEYDKNTHIFPKLQRIDIRKDDLIIGRPKNAGQSGQATLLAMCKRRYGTGSPVKTVRIVDCKVRGDSVTKLREVGPEVEQVKVTDRPKSKTARLIQQLTKDDDDDDDIF